MKESIIILNTKTNTYHVLYRGIIFNRVVAWDYNKLIAAHPKVMGYIETVCKGTENIELVRDIVKGYKDKHPYDCRFDKLEVK